MAIPFDELVEKLSQDEQDAIRILSDKMIKREIKLRERRKLRQQSQRQLRPIPEEDDEI